MMTNGKPYILVVEDDAPVRNLITTTLESQNYKYMAATLSSGHITAWKPLTNSNQKARILF